MERDLGKRIERLKVDGGASANNFLLQFQADILDVVVEKPEMLETTALGAAYLAGLAVGYWQSKEDIKQNWKLAKTFIPSMDEKVRSGLVDGWNRAVGRALDWES